MLTEKDYCDYDTCVALIELGFVGISPIVYTGKGKAIERVSRGLLITPRVANANGWVLGIHLYEAQKWLREEKNMAIVICPYSYNYETETRTWSYEIWIGDNFEEERNCLQSYEEALLEGIKEAIKILKEEK